MTKTYKTDLNGMLIEELETDLEEGIVEKVEVVEDGKTLAHYLVTVPMKERFYAPRFAIETYIGLSEHYVFASQRAKKNFDDQLEGYEINYKMEKEMWENPQQEFRNGNPPEYQPPTFVPLQEPDYTQLWTDTKTPQQIQELQNQTQDPPLPSFLSDKFDSLGNKIEETTGEQNYTQLALADMYEQLLATQEALNRLLEQNKTN